MRCKNCSGSPSVSIELTGQAHQSAISQGEAEENGIVPQLWKDENMVAFLRELFSNGTTCRSECFVSVLLSYTVVLDISNHLIYQPENDHI